MNLLSLQHLKKYYEQHKAVDDISFDIEQGTIFGLLGPNGAGKTTLLRMVTGIIYPDEGEIFFEGKPFHASDDIALIGYMPEERGLYKKMKVGEHVQYLAQLKGLSATEARKKMNYWFGKFSIDSWSDKKVSDLSKGMQQKVQFISTILHEPKLLILDEPFSGLDPINSNLIKNEIFELGRKGTTIIFSTHRMEQVEEICEKIVLVNQGKKLLDGAVDEIKQQFKQSLFSIELQQPVDKQQLQSDIFSFEERTDNQLIVKLEEGYNNNQLLSFFINNNIGIQGFREILPSLNEVFIMQVEKQAQVQEEAFP